MNWLLQQVARVGPILTLWITFTVLALLGVIWVFAWAVRTRQFRDQDRARYLALEAGIPAEPPPLPGTDRSGGEKKCSA